MKDQVSTFVLVAFASLPMLLLYGLLSAKIADDVAWSWATVFFEYIAALIVVALVMFLTRPRFPRK